MGGRSSAGPDAIAIVVDVDGRRAALLVDRLLGQQQVVIKSLGGAGEGLHGVAGGAILGDGRVALILDIGSIVANAARSRAQEEHGTRRGRPKESEKNTQIDAWDADSSVGRSDSGGREPGASGG
jgi:chemotaxis protein histidine kinase CheA